MKLKVIVFSALMLMLVLSACSAFQAPASTVDPTAEATIKTAAQPIAENILQSIDKKDYQGMLRDMDATMTKASTQDSFNQLQSKIATDYGAFQSATYTGVTLTQGYYSVLFNCKFEKGSLTMRLVLDTQAPYQVSGLWFPDMK
jgi:hypothetical protein